MKPEKEQTKKTTNMSWKNKLNMKMEMTHTFQLLYFQVRESPTSLNIPTPTTAPDWNMKKHHLKNGMSQKGNVIMLLNIALVVLKFD